MIKKITIISLLGLPRYHPYFMESMMLVSIICSDPAGRGINGVFGFQQRNGTVENPYVYDPKQYSREYIYFLYSSYPIPAAMLQLLKNLKKNFEGTHFSHYSGSKRDEPFFVILNKEDLSMTGKSLNFKTETSSFSTQCSLRMNDVKMKYLTITLLAMLLIYGCTDEKALGVYTRMY